MMQNSDQLLVEEFAGKVRKLFPSARIWAFGSRARGDNLCDSDLDVCVVVAQVDSNTRRSISHLAWEVGFEKDVLISTVVFSTDQFEDGPCSASPLVKSIRGEGIAA